MEWVSLLAGLVVGAVVAGGATWLVVRAQARATIAAGRAAWEAERATLAERLAGREARVEELLRDAEQKAALHEQLKQVMADTFKALSADVLRSNNQSFLELANATLAKFTEGARTDLENRHKSIAELVKPLRESLDKYQAEAREIERLRTGAYEGLTRQLQHMAEAEARLQNETRALSQALRAPQTRGRWGELQLRRVVELAGMLDHCDFTEQASVDSDEGRLRPDMLIHMPNERLVVVDAKSPLAAYLDAVEAQNDDLRRAKLQDHARQVRSHASRLGEKKYWSQFDPAPDFVVLFLPSESIFSAALQVAPELLEFGWQQRVLIATPTSLIALLRVVALGWREQRIARNAEAISALGRELYDRVVNFAEHLEGVGGGLARAVNKYNEAVGSLESRVLVSARRFRELGAAGGEEIPALESVPAAVRPMAPRLPS